MTPVFNIQADNTSESQKDQTNSKKQGEKAKTVR